MMEGATPARRVGITNSPEERERAVAQEHNRPDIAGPIALAIMEGATLARRVGLTNLPEAGEQAGALDCNRPDVALPKALANPEIQLSLPVWLNYARLLHERWPTYVRHKALKPR